MNRRIVILLLVTLTGGVYAQIGRDTLNFRKTNYVPGILSSLLDKQLSTFTLTDNFVYARNYSNLFIGLNEKFRSTLTKSGGNHIKDEQNFSLLGEYAYTNNFSSGILVKSNIYSDDRNISINEASDHSVSLFGKLQPLKNLSLTPFAGYSVNQQVGELDDGPIYGGEISFDGFRFNELELDSYFKYVNEDIKPRKNNLLNGRIRLKSNFKDAFQNYLDVKYFRQRKDFYFSTDTVTQRFFNITNNIQSRDETQYGISNKFLYLEPSVNSSVELNGGVDWRKIVRNTRYIFIPAASASSFDTDIEELRINLDGAYRYNTSILSTYIRAQYQERQETHTAKRLEGVNEIFYDERSDLERQKNNESRQVTVTASVSSNLSRSDRIYFSLLHRKLVYDTPSDNNFDDRDELLSLFRLGYVRKINPFFSMYINMEAALDHIVYIFAERSSNNNFKRFFKLNSGSVVTSKNIIMKASAEVSANYTIYDFEDLSPNIKSFAFRQFVVRDSSSVRLSSRLFFDVAGYIKLSEQGDFRWEDFKTRPSRFLEEVYFLPKFVFKYQNIILGMGIRFFSLQTYKFNDKVEKIKDKLYNSAGPLADISFITNSLLFKIDGWYEYIRNEDNSRRELVNLSFRMNWNF